MPAIADVLKSKYGIVSVLDQAGADNNGSTSVDNGPHLVAALNELSLTRGGLLVIPPGEYNIDTAAILPIFTGGIVHIYGPGAVLKTDNAINIFDRTPTDNTNANAIINMRFKFEGIRFEGNNTTDQKGLYVNATYGSKLVDCTFANLDIGADMGFALHTVVENCLGSQNETGFINLTNGVGKWTGASSTNSQSNKSVVHNCRDFAKAGADYSYRIHSSSGVKLQNITSEGANVVNAVDFDYGGSTVVKDFKCHDLHCENNPTDAVYRIRSGGGIINIDGLYTATADYLVDFSTGLASTFNFRNMGFVDGFTYLVRTNPQNGSIVSFQDCGRNNELLDPTLWENGLPSASVAVQIEGLEFRGGELILGAEDTDDYANPIIRHQNHQWANRDGEIDLGRSTSDNRWRNLFITGDAHIAHPDYSQTDLRDITHAVNTGDMKRAGYPVWDDTNNKIVVAGGSADGDVWHDADGTTAHTPV